MNENRISENGYSFMELITTLVLIGILFTFSIKYYRFTNRQIISWFNKADKQLVFTKLYETLSRDIEYGYFALETDSLLINLNYGKNYHIYMVNNNLIKRNEKIMYSGDVYIDSILLVIDIINTKTNELTRVSSDTLLRYIENVLPSNKELLYVKDYRFTIYTNSKFINFSLEFHPQYYYSSFHPKKLIDAVSIN